MKWNSFPSCKRRVVFALLLPVVTAQLAFNQTSTTGAIRGTVTDAQGAVIMGATVTVTSTATAQARTVKSDNAGQFTVGLLPPEVYKISISAPGFKTEQPAPVTVVVTETARADAQMVVGSEGEMVEVTSQAPALQVENATLGTVVDGGTIRDLP